MNMTDKELLQHIKMDIGDDIPTVSELCKRYIALRKRIMEAPREMGYAVKMYGQVLNEGTKYALVKLEPSDEQ